MNILFVCTGNTCRSAIAQAYFNARTEECKKPCHADSAGIAAFDGQSASKDAIEVMNELFHIDISKHRSKQVTSEMIKQSDLVLAMTGLHKKILHSSYPDYSNKIFTLIEYHQMIAQEQEQTGSSLEIQDPYGRGESIYTETAKSIAEHIDGIIKWYCEKPDGSAN